MRRFEARWDGGLRASTALASALLLLVSAGGAWMLARDADAPLVGVLAALAPALVVPFAAAFAPRGYALQGSRLVVERALRPVAIPLAEVRRVALLGPGALRGAVRLFGSSGLFGHWGSFRSPTLGAFRAYATRSKDGLVLVETTRARFVLSPEGPQRFVDALLALAPAAERADAAALAPGGVPPSAGGRRRLEPRTVVLLASLAAGPVLAAVVLGASWARAPTSIAVREGAVRVERRTGAPVVIPLESVRELAPLAPEQRRGWRRTNGVAMGALAYGRFRSDALGPFTLYAYRRGPLVVVRTADETFVLGPDEPERFLAEARAGMR